MHWNKSKPTCLVYLEKSNEWHFCIALSFKHRICPTLLFCLLLNIWRLNTQIPQNYLTPLLTKNNIHWSTPACAHRQTIFHPSLSKGHTTLFKMSQCLRIRLLHRCIAASLLTHLKTRPGYACFILCTCKLKNQWKFSWIYHSVF